MRLRPTAAVTCFICSATFTVQNSIDPTAGRRTVRQEPSACPQCDAPLLTIPAIDPGLAKSFLLLLVKAPAETREYTTMRQFLTRFTRTEDELDQLLARARELDLEEWQAFDTIRLRRAPDRGLKSVLRHIAILRAIPRDELLARLEAAVARVRVTHAKRRHRHLAIRDERRVSRA